MFIKAYLVFLRALSYIKLVLVQITFYTNTKHINATTKTNIFSYAQVQAVLMIAYSLK